MGKKVFLVSSGCYSAYKVEAIFTIRKKAEAYIKNIKKAYNGYNDIEEIELDKEFKKIKYSLWHVEMEKNGKVIDCKEMITRIDREGIDIDIDYYIDVCNDGHFYVDAKDETHAIKIANEKRAYLVANEAWEQTEL